MSEVYDFVLRFSFQFSTFKKLFSIFHHLSSNLGLSNKIVEVGKSASSPILCRTGSWL